MLELRPVRVWSCPRSTPIYWFPCETNLLKYLEGKISSFFEVMKELFSFPMTSSGFVNLGLSAVWKKSPFLFALSQIRLTAKKKGLPVEVEQSMSELDIRTFWLGPVRVYKIIEFESKCQVRVIFSSCKSCYSITKIFEDSLKTNNYFVFFIVKFEFVIVSNFWY